MDPGVRSDLERLFERLGAPLDTAGVLTTASRSQVIECRGGALQAVLRIAGGRPGHSRPDCERLVRAQLDELGLPVPRPLADPAGHPDLFEGAAWTLDGLCRGTHPGRGAVPVAAARALGGVLAALHRLDAAGWGPVGGTRDGTAIGREETCLAGLAARFDLPNDRAAILAAERRIALVDPAVAPVVVPIVGWIRARTGRGVICHTDLHERNILVEGGRLTGLIDFADMAVLPPAWDFGSVRYFHGPECLEAGAGRLWRPCTDTGGTAAGGGLGLGRDRIAQGRAFNPAREAPSTGGGRGPFAADARRRRAVSPAVLNSAGKCSCCVPYRRGDAHGVGQETERPASRLCRAAADVLRCDRSRGGACI